MVELLPHAAVSSFQNAVRVLELLGHLQICLAIKRDLEGIIFSCALVPRDISVSRFCFLQRFARQAEIEDGPKA